MNDERSTIDNQRVDLRSGLVASLAGNAGYRLDQWLASTFNQNFDAYDKAVDAVYNATRVGGSALHHLLDQQHDLLGAFAAVKDVAADDSFARELTQAGEHLLRDTASISGTNMLFSLTPQQFDAVAKSVADTGVTKTYLADAFTVNGSELLGGVIALAAAIVVARKGSPDQVSRLGGGMLMSSLASGNPALLGIGAASLAYAAWKGECRKEMAVQCGKGALVSGAAILATNLLGGPIWWGCVVGMGTAVLMGKAVDNPEKTYQRVCALVKPAAYVLRRAGELAIAKCKL